MTDPRDAPGDVDAPVISGSGAGRHFGVGEDGSLVTDNPEAEHPERVPEDADPLGRRRGLRRGGIVLGAGFALMAGVGILAGDWFLAGAATALAAGIVGVSIVRLRRMTFLLAAVLLIAGAIALAPGDAAAQASPGTAPNDKEWEECITCDFFNRIEDIKTRYGHELFRTVSGGLTEFVRYAVLAYLVFQAAVYMIDPARAGDRLKALAAKALWLPFLAAAMVNVGPDGTPWVWGWIIQPMEKTALQLGVLIIDAARLVSPGNSLPATTQAAGSYASLAEMVETQVKAVFKITYALIMNPQNTMADTSLPARIAGGILLLLPYLFVIGIFCAFLLEALFKYVAIGIVAPLLLWCAAFEPLRAFSTAGVRVLLGAFLTVVFASGAMGLTAAVLKTQMDRSYNQMMGAAFEMSNAADGVEQACGREGDPDGRGYIPPPPTPEGEAACADAQARAARADRAFVVFNKDFVALLIIGFVSILLHLSSKTLASNMSGANDGAGPAAAVVLGAKMALGMATMGATRGLFGQGGAGASFQDALRGGGQVGQAFQRHGLIGGLPAAMLSGGAPATADGGLTTTASSQAASVAPGLPGGGPSYSAGPGGPMSDQDMKRWSMAVATAFKDVMGKGGGLNRRGEA